jgi:AcrR family transcriptional regulator
VATTRAEQAEQTRRRILETARQLFAEHGYDATSLQAIADTLGITKANVYYYFRTKAAILEAITEASQTRLGEIFDQAEEIEDRRERVEFVIDAWVDLVVLQHSITQSDPSLRRQPKIAAAMDALGRRGLQVLFGDEPTIDEQVAYHLVSDLGPLLSRLPDLPADALKRVCRRLIP